MGHNFDKLMKELKEFEDSKKTKILRGDNVIHLEYYNGILSDDDIDGIDEKFNKLQLVLSYHDKNGSCYNCLENFTLDVFLIIPPPLIIELMKNIGFSSAYDCVKSSIIHIYNKVKNKKIYERTGNSIKENDVKFGIKINSPHNGSFSFEYNGDMSEEKIDDYFHKALNVYENSTNNGLYYCKYNADSGSLDKLDICEEIKQSKSKKDV